MPVGNEPTSGGISAHRRPPNFHDVERYLPHHKPQIVGSRQREELREKYAEALEKNPNLTRAAFARSVALEYGVSAATIRNNVLDR